MKKIIILLLSTFFMRGQTLIKYSQLQSAFGNNTTFLGSTDNRSLLIKTNGVARVKADSLGYWYFNSSNFPATGEPNEFYSLVTQSVTQNNYLLRSSLNFSNSVTNTAARIGALLGVTDILAGTTPTLGWSVGVYGASYNHSSGLISRQIGGLFLTRIYAGSTNTVLTGASVYADREFTGGYTESSYGLLVTTPAVTGGTINTNYGLYIAPQAGIGATNNWAINCTGSSDLSNFAGRLITNSFTPTYVTSTYTMQDNPSIINNKFLKGIGTDGVAYTLIGMNTGDNITITGKAGTTDILLNPTATSKGSILKTAGRWGFFGATGTALIHIGTNGSASASNAPIKLTVAGSTLMTTPEAGAVEVDANGVLYFTPVSTRYQIPVSITGSSTLDFASTVAGATTDMTITVTGAADGDAVNPGVPNGSMPAGGCFTAWVSATNVVTIRYTNNSLVTTYDPASGTFRPRVFKQ